ncbi:MAG TPA: hypothetical protein VII74_09280, partial [Chthoniobacterales bacterium]
MTRGKLFCLTMAGWCALAPLAAAAPTATPAPTATATPTPVADLTAQHALAERTKMYRAGAAYSRWLDGLAQESGNQFLQERAVDRITWMRLFACLVSLAIIAAFTSIFLWFVRRKAGAIESNQRQSWFALAAAAIRKPLALIVWVLGGFLAFMPIVAGISVRSERIVFAEVLTALLYAGRVIAVLWLIFQGVRAVEKRMRLWAQSTGSVLNNVIVPVAGQALRLAVPLLAILLLLPLLGLPEKWDWL